MMAVSSKGIAFTIRTYQAPDIADMSADEKKIGALLLAALDGSSPLPVVPWQADGLLAADLCTVVASHFAPLMEKDGIPAQVEALTPDRRACDDSADPTGYQSRFTVEAELATGIGNPGAPKTVTIAGHDALIDGGDRSCRIAVSFPDDPALSTRRDEQTPGIQLFVGATYGCAATTKATEALVTALDQG